MKNTRLFKKTFLVFSICSSLCEAMHEHKSNAASTAHSLFTPAVVQPIMYTAEQKRIIQSALVPLKIPQESSYLLDDPLRDRPRNTLQLGANVATLYTHIASQAIAAGEFENARFYLLRIVDLLFRTPLNCPLSELHAQATYNLTKLEELVDFPNKSRGSFRDMDYARVATLSNGPLKGLAYVNLAAFHLQVDDSRRHRSTISSAGMAARYLDLAAACPGMDRTALLWLSTALKKSEAICQD